MKTIGIQLSNYAGLKAQFIPLDGGLRLIAGKNNSGKSATLRFLNLAHDKAIADFAEGRILRWSIIRTIEPKDGVLGQFFGDSAALAEAEATIEFFFERQGNSGSKPSRDFKRAVLHPNTLYPKSFEVLVGGTVAPQVSQWVDVRQRRAIPLGQTLDSLLDDLAVIDNPIFIAPHRSVSDQVPINTVRAVPSDGNQLATHLQTLNNEERHVFQNIESDFCRMFPEFSGIDMVGKNSEISLSLRRRPANGERVPLSRCGNGLEQALILITAIHGSKADQLLLLDEPHNFLHPGAERTLLNIFLASKKPILAATHSPTLINGVAPDKVTLISPPGESFEEYRSRSAVPAREPILRDIGFRNSDALFHDFLVFVEGPSDAEILPILLAGLGMEQDKSGSVGFPILEGVEKLQRPEQVQTKLIFYEKLLGAMGEQKQKHIYFFDGDRNFLNETLEKTNIEGRALNLHFTSEAEIENALLVPEAIAAAIRQQSELDGATVAGLTAQDIREKLAAVRARVPAVLKGSKILSEIFQDYSLVYDKRITGKILARNIPPNHSAVRELCLPILNLVGEA